MFTPGTSTGVLPDGRKVGVMFPRSGCCKSTTPRRTRTGDRPPPHEILVWRWPPAPLEPWEQWRVEPGEVRDVGECVLVRMMVTARGSSSSVELTADSGVVFEFL